MQLSAIIRSSMRYENNYFLAKSCQNVRTKIEISKLRHGIFSVFYIQHFATQLYNFTNFKIFFRAVVYTAEFIIRAQT